MGAMRGLFLVAAAVVTAVVLGADATSAHKPGTVPVIGDCIDFSSPSPCDDTDGDGFINQVEWTAGSDATNPASTPEYGLIDEQWGLTTCGDRIDNDLDGRLDQADPGCHVTCKDFTTPALCRDQDEDGWPGYAEEELGSDPNDGASTPEHSAVPATCSDGVDNDRDGLVDVGDIGSGCCIDFVNDTACEPF